MNRFTERLTVALDLQKKAFDRVYKNTIIRCGIIQQNRFMEPSHSK